jgi:hypothetical protein
MKYEHLFIRSYIQPMLIQRFQSPSPPPADRPDPHPALLDDDAVVALAETFRMLGTLRL